MDRTENGRGPKRLPVVDVFTRGPRDILVEREHHRARRGRLAGAPVSDPGTPEFIRAANGRQFIANVVKPDSSAPGRARVHRAGSPWQSAYSETFDGRFEDELLKREIFTIQTTGSCQHGFRCPSNLRRSLVQ
jgi:putative transposase